jgi:hypothetical protein
MYNNKFEDSKSTPTKRTNASNQINLDYDYNTEYGDGDIPDIDKPGSNKKEEQKES